MKSFFLLLTLVSYSSSNLCRFSVTNVLDSHQFIGNVVRYKVTTSKLKCMIFCLGREEITFKASWCNNTCYCYRKSIGYISMNNCWSAEYKLDNKLKNCFDIYRCYSQGNGIYSIIISGNLSQVYCDMDRGGWTVIQRRLDGSVDFQRSYADYQKGFGDKLGEHWLGLDLIRGIVISGGVYEVRFDLEDFDGVQGYAEYSLFNIADMNLSYKLEISGYNGNVGDGMALHNGMGFSTMDHDISQDSCVSAYKGAWWYANCHTVNINGLYNNTEYGKGLNWNNWRGFFYSLKSTSIKIRPKQ